MQEKVILLIEDDPDDVELTLRSLNKSNLYNNITVLRDGVEAMDYFFGEGYESRELPQLIILDLKLPKISGLELLEKLRSDERTKLLPIVILSSSEEGPDIEASYELGANSYVRKPIDFVQFSEAVRQLGLYWLLLNQPPPSKRL